jgi:hypothetical protein
MLRLALVALLFTATTAVAEQFKVRCERDDLYYVGFDLEKKTAFWKARRGMMYRGEVFSVSNKEIVFGLFLGNPIKPDILYKRGERTPFWVKRDDRWEQDLYMTSCVPTQEGPDFQR